MEFDFSKIADFAFFEWAKQEGIWKYFAAIFIFTAAIGIASLYMSSELLSPLTLIKSATTTQAINAIFHFLSFIVLLVAVSAIIGSAFSYILIAKALKAKGRKFVEFSATRWLLFIVLCIANFFAALLSIFKLRMLAIGIAGTVLLAISILLLAFVGFSANIAIGILAIIFFALGLLLILAYTVIVIYNYLRLAVSEVAFIEKERGIVESMKLSWNATRSSVLLILVALIIVGVIAAVISFIGSIPLLIYSIVTGISNADTANTIMNFSPTFLVLNIPAFITSAIATIIGAFGIVGIYEELMGKAVSPANKPRKIARRSLKRN